jgi:hypothetical protein
MGGYSEGDCLSPFTISPYLSPTAAVATSTRPSQLHSLPLGWAVNYDRRRGWEDEVRGVTPWWRQEFSLHGLIVMRTATLDKNVKKKRTQHLGAQMELLSYVHSLTLPPHCGWIVMHSSLWAAVLLKQEQITSTTQYNRSNSKLQIFLFNIQSLGKLRICNSVLWINKGKLVNTVKVLKQ